MSILTESREGAVAILTLNRPEKLNALNQELLAALYGAVTALEVDAAVRAVVVTGAGEKAFAAGADIVAMTEMTAAQGRGFSALGHALGRAMESSRMPFIAAVNGFALGGGCELALACDFIYASESARFGQPEVNLGVIPGFGGTNRLARRVGIARTRELCFTGDVIKADEALRIGLCNAVVPTIELMARAKATAAKITEKGPLAIAQCKRVLNRGEGMALDAANELESQAFGSLFGSADQREGMRAFVAKRKAVFTGA